MRNPFIASGTVPADRLAFIVATKGGSAWLWAGGLFWTVAGIAGLLTPVETWTRVYLYGGFGVPLVGWLLARIQGVRVPKRSPLVPLVVIASSMTPFCFPVLLLIERENAALLPVALTIVDGAHLLILMWVQLDYAFLLAALAKLAIGVVFGFALQDQAASGVGFASAVVSFAAGFSVYRDARNAFKLYAPGPEAR